MSPKKNNRRILRVMLKYKNEILCVSQNQYQIEYSLPTTIFQKYEKVFDGSKYMYLEIFFG